MIQPYSPYMKIPSNMIILATFFNRIFACWSSFFLFGVQRRRCLPPWQVIGCKGPRFLYEALITVTPDIRYFSNYNGSFQRIFQMINGIKSSAELIHLFFCFFLYFSFYLNFRMNTIDQPLSERSSCLKTTMSPYFCEFSGMCCLHKKWLCYCFSQK